MLAIIIKAIIIKRLLLKRAMFCYSRIMYKRKEVNGYAKRRWHRPTKGR